MIGRGACPMALLLLAALGTAARGQDPLAIRILAAPTASRAVISFLRAELLAEGFAVEEQLASDPQALAGQAAPRLFATVVPDPAGARAAARVQFHHPRRLAPGAAVAVDIDVGPARDDGVRLMSTLAVRVSELLRARAEVSRAPAPPPAAAPGGDTGPRSELRLEVLLAGGRAMTEAGVAIGPAAGLSFRQRGGLLLRVGVETLVTGQRLTAPGGSVSVMQTLALGEAGYEGRWGTRLAPAGTVGVGAAHTLARGRAQPGYSASTEGSLSPALTLGGGVSLRLGNRVWITVAGRLFHVVAAPAVAIAGEPAGHVQAVAWHGWTGVRLGL